MYVECLGDGEPCRSSKHGRNCRSMQGWEDGARHQSCLHSRRRVTPLSWVMNLFVQTGGIRHRLLQLGLPRLTQGALVPQPLVRDLEIHLTEITWLESFSYSIISLAATRCITLEWNYTAQVLTWQMAIINTPSPLSNSYDMGSVVMHPVGSDVSGSEFSYANGSATEKICGKRYTSFFIISVWGVMLRVSGMFMLHSVVFLIPGEGGSLMVFI